MPNLEPNRFWNLVAQRRPEECWEWTGCRNGRKYGRFAFNGRTEYSHRMAYRFAIGTIPDRMEVCHQCDNPGCCNPNHLFLGTHQQNLPDASRKGRMAHGENHSGTVLTGEDVKTIRYLAAEGGITQREIADRFGVRQQCISRIVAGLRRAKG